MGNHRFRDENNTQTINFSYQTLWDLTDNILETSGLENYWENCLAAISDQSNHPLLVWGPHPSLDIDNYNVYRKINNQSFTKIGTTDNNTYEYTDDDFLLNGPVSLLYYVTGSYNSLNEASATNTVVTDGGLYKQNNEGTKNINSDFSLSQNYPNPFNPTTQIDYSVKFSGIVTLKVFNMLGQEVATLVNAKKKAGNYTAVFNAANLPSGIYVYRLSSQNFSLSKKLILLR